MAHPLSTQALGNFDIPQGINGTPHHQFGKLSYVAIPHDWMMMKAKYVDTIDFHAISYGGGRADGLGHGGEGSGYFDCTGKNSGLRNGDWDGGFFLEECHAKDCFFGCGGSHFSQADHIAHYDFHTKDWGSDIDHGQDYFNSKNTSISGKACVEVNRFVRSPWYPPAMDIF
jgi:hypothetical protein